MADETEVEEAASTARMNRRRLLQGGVATGVALAAFNGPGVKYLGTLPAYAAVCTAPLKTLTSGEINANCGGNSCDDFVSYGNQGNNVYNISGGGLTGTLTFTNTCSAGSGAPVSISVAGGGVDYTCWVSSVNVATANGNESFPQVDACCAPPIPRQGNRCSAQLTLTVTCCPTVNYH